MSKTGLLFHCMGSEIRYSANIGVQFLESNCLSANLSFLVSSNVKRGPENLFQFPVW